MKTLYLEDYKDLTKSELLNTIAKDFEVSQKDLGKFHVLIAYKSVGNWGCDSNAWLLLKDKQTKELFEVHASHCSCYGFEQQFEQQFEPEETNLQYLKSDKFRYSTGGYDSNDQSNTEQVIDFIKAMRNVT